MPDPDQMFTALRDSECPSCYRTIYKGEDAGRVSGVVHCAACWDEVPA